MPVLAYNKRANFDYEITDKFEAGIVLFGHEVKALKNKHVSLKGAFVSIQAEKKNHELFLKNTHISMYKKASNLDNYDPERPRKLLLHKNQIKRLIGKKKEQGLTLVPIKLYTKHNLIKLEFGIGKGKKKYDKRNSIKKRELDRKVRTLTKEKYR
jgi:SsrA-binding protein